jgi:nicotinate-nucleotide adenylyltransferase
MKIGLCGGTFDPFHRGHLDPVLAARDHMKWDQVVYIPAYRQPFKTGQRTESGQHRFAMAVLATETFDEIFVSPQELDRGAISYTVETLEMLRMTSPDAILDWIIGDDNLAELHLWKDIDRIFELGNFVVLTRLADANSVPERFRSRLVLSPSQRGRCGSIVFAKNPTVQVSSTEIRRRLRAGESIKGLVDPRVSRYIQHNGLYREVQT